MSVGGTFSTPRAYLPPAAPKKLKDDEIKASAERLSTRVRKDVKLPPLHEKRVLTAEVMSKSLDRLYTSAISHKKVMLEELEKRAHPDLVKHHQLDQEGMSDMFNRLYTASMQRKEDTLTKLRSRYLAHQAKAVRLDKDALAASAARLCTESIEHSRQNHKALFEKYVTSTEPAAKKLSKEQLAESASRLSKK